MIAYPDTSFLCALYGNQIHSPKAIDSFRRLGHPLSVTSLLLYEFRQSVRFQPWLFSNQRGKGYPQDIAHGILAGLQADLAKGIYIVEPVDWPDVHAVAERLSAQYTFDEGHRAFDILHVATALHLGAWEFLTFDEKQKTLAKAEGLKVRP